ncbi:MAG: hypothetical protein EAX90_11075 [Candidatus Heimdallarchaeota archaeon]|nr:hypothetical protein [Candidatus Heimdallarchaeota archaeon]
MVEGKIKNADSLTALTFLNYLSVLAAIVLVFGIVYVILVGVFFDSIQTDSSSFESWKQLSIGIFIICLSIATLVYSNIRWGHKS